MLYLGTIRDSRYGDYSSMFMNDAFYAEVDKIWSICVPVQPQILGLNRTWPLLQTWKSFGIKSGAECINCKRVVPPLDDAAFERYHWRYAEPARPNASKVICSPCAIYERQYGEPRPARLEDRRKNVVFPTRPNPHHCEHEGCPRTIGIVWVSRHHRFCCQTHAGRARSGLEMNGHVLVEPRTVVAAVGTNPSTRQHDGCSKTHDINWCGPHQTWYCQFHEKLAYHGRDMATQPSRSTAPTTTVQGGERPTQCQFHNCSNDTGIKWCGLEGHNQLYCQAHYRRANLGSDMEPVIEKKQAKSAHYQWETCVRSSRMQMCYVEGHNKVYCGAHYKRPGRVINTDATILKDTTKGDQMRDETGGLHSHPENYKFLKSALLSLDALQSKYCFWFSA